MKKVRFLLLGMQLLPFLVNAQKRHLQPYSYYSNNSLKNIKSQTDTVMTRGVSYSDFKKSVKEFDDQNPSRLDSAWFLWKNKKWGELEQMFKNKTLNKNALQISVLYHRS